MGTEALARYRRPVSPRSGLSRLTFACLLPRNSLRLVSEASRLPPSFCPTSLRGLEAAPERYQENSQLSKGRCLGRAHIIQWAVIAYSRWFVKCFPSFWYIAASVRPPCRGQFD
jgi:hypothetical protein